MASLWLRESYQTRQRSVLYLARVSCATDDVLDETLSRMTAAFIQRPTVKTRSDHVGYHTAVLLSLLQSNFHRFTHSHKTQHPIIMSDNVESNAQSRAIRVEWTLLSSALCQTMREGLYYAQHSTACESTIVHHLSKLRCDVWVEEKRVSLRRALRGRHITVTLTLVVVLSTDSLYSH